MAKILDKRLTAAKQRADKLRLQYDWLRTESELLPADCQEKKEKALNKFIRKSNKKLQKSTKLFWPKLELKTKKTSRPLYNKIATISITTN